MSFDTRKEYLKYLEQKHLAIRKGLTNVAIMIFSLPSSIFSIVKEIRIFSEFFQMIVFWSLFVQFSLIAFYAFYLYLYSKVGYLYYYELGALCVERDKDRLEKILEDNKEYNEVEIKKKSEEIAKTLSYSETELIAVKIFMEKAGIVKKIKKEGGSAFTVKWSV